MLEPIMGKADRVFKPVLIKAGGSLVADGAPLKALIAEIADLRACGGIPVVVHGGGDEISQELELRGIRPQFANGLRITDEATLATTEMVLSGRINKRITGYLTQAGCPAVGISGRDGGLLSAKKTAGESSSLGLVGEVAHVDPCLLEVLLDGGFTPVVSPVSADADGQTLNINADAAAAAIAAKLQVGYALFLTEVGGVYDADKRILPELSLRDVPKLIKDGVISHGMLPKLASVSKLLESGIACVYICGCGQGKITSLAVHGQQTGTRILP